MKAAVLTILILCMPFALMAGTFDAADLAENPAEISLQDAAESCENLTGDNSVQQIPSSAGIAPGSCSASAVCWDGSTITCWSLSAFGGCSSGNHDCSVPRDGWVRCGSTFKSCPGGCPTGSGECTQGASCISGIDCGADGQCAGGTCQCD